MSGLRRSTRATTSTINVKLNEKNEIEYFKVENDVEEEEDNDDIMNDPDYTRIGNDDICDENEDEVEVEEEEEEELIANPDGTMSIKIPTIKPKKKIVPVHHICAKCSKVLSSGAVCYIVLKKYANHPWFNSFFQFQALKRHLNLCKNLPKNAISNENDVEFDFSSIDVNDPIYEDVCICCNEEKETAHVS